MASHLNNDGRGMEALLFNEFFFLQVLIVDWILFRLTHRDAEALREKQKKKEAAAAAGGAAAFPPAAKGKSKWNFLLIVSHKNNYTYMKEWLTGDIEDDSCKLPIILLYRI